MTERRRWLGIVFGISLATAALGSELFVLREPGEPLPAMTLYDLEGQGHDLRREQAGRPAVLFFWSVYCPNCKEAIPEILELHRTRSPELLVWAINVDGERFSNGVRAYVEDLGLPFPVLYDRLEGEYLVAADPLGVSKTPTLYLAGEDGKILLRQVIQMDVPAVEALLEDR